MNVSIVLKFCFCELMIRRTLFADGRTRIIRLLVKAWSFELFEASLHLLQLLFQSLTLSVVAVLVGLHLILLRLLPLVESLHALSSHLSRAKDISAKDFPGLDSTLQNFEAQIRSRVDSTGIHSKVYDLMECVFMCKSTSTVHHKKAQRALANTPDL